MSRSDQHVLDYLGELEHEAKTRDSLRNQTREAYRGARVGRLNKDWMPEHRSGDAAIAESWDLLTSRIRDEIRNSPIFSGAKNTLVDLIVGPGVQTFFSPPLLDDQSSYFDYALESDEAFEDWALNWADAEGRLTWFDMQRLAMGEIIETGDVMLLECSRREAGRTVPLCYQLLEREQLDFTKDRPAQAGQYAIVHGIEIDASNRPVRYHIFDAHPYDTHISGASSYKSTPVPASRVKHIYWPSRPSAHIGVSWFHSLAQDGRDRDWYANAELTGAAIAAQFVAIVKREHPGSGAIGMDDGVDSSEDLNEPVKLGAGLIFEGGENDGVEIIESKRPSQFAPEFLKFIDHNIAAGARLSYCRLTGRYEATSYTAARAAHLDDEAKVAPVKSFFANKVLLPTRKQFNSQAAALGVLSEVSPSDFRRHEKVLQRFEAIGPGREQLDPESETEASVSKLRSGLSTLRTECGLRGKHWVRVLRQKAIENQLATELGVVLDYSKGQGGLAKKTTSQAE